MSKRTAKSLYAEISEFRKTGKTYGWIAKKLLPGQHPASAKSIIYRFYKAHKEIRDNEIRLQLGLEKLIEVPESYIRKGYISPQKKYPRPHRFAIYSSMEHIDRTIESMRNHMEDEVIREIKERL